MLIYFMLLAGVLILGLLLCRSRIGNLIYCIVTGIALFVVSALRLSVGYDYNSYATIYLRYISTPVEDVSVSRIEKGYAMINKLLADYFPDYRVIFTITAAFFAAAVTVCIYRNCKKPYLGFAFFLTLGAYFNTLNFVRQMLAAFIVLYALRYVRKKQFFRYVLIVLFASCFHFSALMMIPFYFILRIKMNPTALAVYSGVTVLIMVFSWNVMDLITRYIYKSYNPRLSVHVLNGVFPVYMVFFGAFFILAFIFRKRLIRMDPFNNVLINCSYFLFFFELIGVKHSIASRPGLFFVVPVAAILMPRLFEAVLAWCREKAGREKNRRLAYSIAAVSAFAVVNIGLFSIMVANNYNGTVPYRTWIESTETEAAQ